MEKIIEFLSKNEQISVRTICEALDLPGGSINVSKGYIPQKYIGPVRDHLKKVYGMNMDKEVLLDNPAAGEKKLRWNDGRPYDFTDNIGRYQDEWGLWHQILDAQMVPEIPKRGGGFMENVWSAANAGEFLSDWRGYYMVLKNGVKVYLEAHDYVKNRRSVKSDYYKRVDYKKKWEDKK